MVPVCHCQWGGGGGGGGAGGGNDTVTELGGGYIPGIIIDPLFIWHQRMYMIVI